MKEEYEEYLEYLKSDHWKSFRKETLRKRIQCQWCGTKKNLNIHHKHYRTIGREQNGDVIVLCQNCHINASYGWYPFKFIKSYCLERRFYNYWKHDKERILTFEWMSVTKEGGGKYYSMILTQ